MCHTHAFIQFIDPFNDSTIPSVPSFLPAFFVASRSLVQGEELIDNAVGEDVVGVEAPPEGIELCHWVTGRQAQSYRLQVPEVVHFDFGPMLCRSVRLHYLLHQSAVIKETAQAPAPI